VTKVNVRGLDLRAQVNDKRAIEKAMRLSKIHAHDLSVPAWARRPAPA
jgi:hypothetical protein